MIFLSQRPISSTPGLEMNGAAASPAWVASSAFWISSAEVADLHVAQIHVDGAGELRRHLLEHLAALIGGAQIVGDFHRLFGHFLGGRIAQRQQQTRQGRVLSGVIVISVGLSILVPIGSWRAAQRQNVIAADGADRRRHRIDRHLGAAQCSVPAASWPSCTQPMSPPDAADGRLAELARDLGEIAARLELLFDALRGLQHLGILVGIVHREEDFADQVMRLVGALGITRQFGIHFGGA